MPRTRRPDALVMARGVAEALGREVTLARTNLALSRNSAAALAGVSPSTQQRVELGDPAVQLITACRVASAVGLKVWGKAFPVQSISLRDSGQLRIAEILRHAGNRSFRIVLELSLEGGRSADMAFFGPDEVILVEIERMLADFQAQYRAAVSKRDELAAIHQRPVRLVLAIEDTHRNRRAVQPHAALIRSALPAGSREIASIVRTGRTLGRDGILWIRPRRPVDRSSGRS